MEKLWSPVCGWGSSVEKHGSEFSWRNDGENLGLLWVCGALVETWAWVSVYGVVFSS